MADSTTADHAGAPPTDYNPPGFRAIGMALLVALLLAMIGLLVLHLRRSARERRQVEALAQTYRDGPRVTVVQVTQAARQRDVTLPAEVRALVQSTIF